MWFDIQGKALKVQGFKKSFKVNLEKPLKVFHGSNFNKTSNGFGSLFPLGLMWNYRMVQS
jgi:hypothetical protein